MTETKNFVGQSHVLSPPLTTGTWSFGPLNEPFLTNSLVLSPSGKIEGYSHPNEYSWRIENHHVLILSEDGNIMWRSVEEFQNEDNLLTIMFEHPGDANTKFILVQNPSNSNSIPSSANQEPIDKPAPTGLSDAEFLFPSDLEITSVKIDKVLLVGSCLTSLYHEQLQARHPETQFDYIPYNFVSVLPPTPPSPLEEYSFQYIQIPLRSILSDRIVWGFALANPVLQTLYCKMHIILLMQCLLPL